MKLRTLNLIIFAILLATTLLMSGCGVVEKLGKNCGGHFESICHDIFGENSTLIDANTAEIERIKQRLAELQAEYTAIFEDNAQYWEVEFALLSNNLEQAQLDLSLLESNTTAEALALQAQIDALTTELSQVDIGLDQAQTDLNNVLLDIVELQTREGIVALLDPCGNLAGSYDEVLIKLSSGKVIAYFEVGGQRFLSELVPNVNYKTTDVQQCLFSIDASGNLQ